MGIVQRIKDLADAKNTNFAEIERKVGLSNGQIRRWDNASPKVENIEKVADFFSVSVDYLLGKSEALKSNLTVIPDDLNKVLDEMKSFDGKPMTPHDREVIRAYLEGKFADK